jgi:macrolide-specific efflux system membrane fusion protein
MIHFPPSLRRRPFRSIGIVIVLLLLLLLAWRAFFYKSAPSYLTVPVTRGNIEQAVLATGTIRPLQQVSVGAQVSGQIKSLKVTLGERVKRGQLLAEIDPTIQQNQLRSDEADLRDDRAQLTAKRAELHRYELEQRRQAVLLKQDATSRAEYEEASKNVVTARADLASLQARIDKSNVTIATDRANLGYTRITAPIDGEVIAIVTQEGQTIVSSQTAPVILILANLDTMTVRAKISEADVVRIKPGMPIHFTVLGAPDKSYVSRLRAVEPAPESIKSEDATQATADQTNNAVYYNGLFDVPNPGHTLRTMIVLGSAKHALLLPIAALGARQKDDRHYQVQVLVNGQPQTRQITVGLMNDIDVQVLSGLSKGEQVIVDDTTEDDAKPGGSIRIGSKS